MRWSTFEWSGHFLFSFPLTVYVMILVPCCHFCLPFPSKSDEISEIIPCLINVKSNTTFYCPVRYFLFHSSWADLLKSHFLLSSHQEGSEHTFTSQSESQCSYMICFGFIVMDQCGPFKHGTVKWPSRKTAAHLCCAVCLVRSSGVSTARHELQQLQKG